MLSLRRRIVGPGVEPVPIDRSFQVIPRRWVVERTYGWLRQYRRLSKDARVFARDV